ncbi:DUF1281 domain-containing protein [Scandinavium sp. NPDC088450]|uniref:DUF1281 domain-containing protein n=1 Tax=Scandinavium sp. NPDC088450 TaxID=3364514 RepID=UPI00384EA521
MPNWCANRFYITGKPEHITRVRALLKGDTPPWPELAIQQSVSFFIAGIAGVLKPVIDVEYAPFPALVSAGPGDDNVQNSAFTQWLSLLAECAELDEETCSLIGELYTRASLGQITWDAFPESRKTAVRPVIAQKYHDWGGSLISACQPDAEFWARLQNNVPSRTGFDMRQLLPTCLDVEVNGFNGGLLGGVDGGYAFYTWQRYGIKWPTGLTVDIAWESEESLTVDFDTPWSPPDERVVALLSERYDCQLSHYYSEAGGDYCGFREYLEGECLSQGDSSLEYEEEETEEGWSTICGPDWILTNVAHFGG